MNKENKTDKIIKSLPIEAQKAYQKIKDEIKALIIHQTDFDNFCNSLTEIIQNNLSPYFVHLYLVEKSRGYVVLKAGTGRISHSAIQKGHKFEITPNSFIGEVAFTRKANFVFTDKQPDSYVWHSSVDLPPVQAELGIPIISGSFLIGVLDICSNQYNAFQIEDGIVLEEILSETEIFFKKFQL